MSRNDDGTEFYALDYDSEPEVWMADGRHLTSTGERRRPEEFDSGITIRVSRDGELLDD